MKITTYNKENLRLLNMNIYCEYKLDDKPALFLIHGFVSSISTFRKMIPLLSKHYSIIAIDLPGFGNSEKCTNFIYTYENYGKLIAACIDYFNLERVSLIGHSMGGQIALHAAKIVPEKIDKLVLLASSGYLGKASMIKRYSSYLPFSEIVAKFVVHKKTVPDYLKNVLYDHTFITDELTEAYSLPLQDKKFYKSLLRLLRYREGDLPSEQLKLIQNPALLIWGKEDRVVPITVGLQLKQDLPNSNLITYDRTGHLLTIEQSEAVSHNILSFVGR